MEKFYMGLGCHVSQILSSLSDCFDNAVKDHIINYLFFEVP